MHEEERRTTENQLMYKAALLYKELKIAKGYIQDVRRVLENWDSSKDFIKDIGYPFISKMPKFTILQNEADKVKKGLRKVCSGEVSIEDAIEKSKRIEENLDEVLQVLNEEKLRPYCKQ